MFVLDKKIFVSKNYSKWSPKKMYNKMDKKFKINVNTKTNAYAGQTKISGTLGKKASYANICVYANNCGCLVKDLHNLK